MTRQHLLRRMGVALAMGGLAVTAACSSGSSSSSDSSGGSSGGGSGSIVIGAFGGASGAQQAYGLDEKRGWEIVQDDINAQGGILGKKLEIRYQDDQSDPTQSRSIMQKFTTDKSVIGVMGPTYTSTALASQPLAVQAHLSVISVSNSGDKIVSQGPEIYRIFVPDPVLEKLVVQKVVTDLKLTRVGIIFAQDDPAPVDTEKAFENALTSSGVQVVQKVGYAKAQPDLGAQIRQLKSANPQAVFAASYSAEDAGSFLRQASTQGLTVPVIGSQTFNSPGVLQIAGNKANPLIVGSQWFAGDPSALNQNFVSTFESKYHAEPGEFAAMAYNGGLVIKAALEASKDPSRKGLLAGLATLTQVTGLLGAPITFKDRDATTATPIMLTASGTKFTLYGKAN